MTVPKTFESQPVRYCSECGRIVPDVDSRQHRDAHKQFDMVLRRLEARYDGRLVATFGPEPWTERLVRRGG